MDRFSDEITEHSDFLSRQLITYIGNKRSLLPFIGEALSKVKKKLNRNKLTLFDAFSGSGTVARYFKAHADMLIANDLEAYSQTVNRCYLANSNELPLSTLTLIHKELLFKLTNEPLTKGFISELYSPRNADDIKSSERVFYTPRNALFIDTARQHIEKIVPVNLRHFFIAPLLSEASIHANTAGVFKGFYKDSSTGKGCFGGSAGNALSRITGDIDLPFPVWSNFNCPVQIFKDDANALALQLPELDLAYFDPPYNQHPYGSNYFMLNLILSYQRPSSISPVSGIPPDWNRSVYNKRAQAASALRNLALAVKAKYILISFNSEGFISSSEMKAMLASVGKVEVFQKVYNTFRGSRNLHTRRTHVQEYLFLVEK